MDAVETFEVEEAGLTATVRIYQDDDPMSPADWDTFGTFGHWHRRYELGDENIRGTAWMDRAAGSRFGLGYAVRYLQLVRGAVAVVPVGMLDHSVITVYADGAICFDDSGGWDSGTVGLYWATWEDCENLGVDPADAEKAIRQEIATWAQYYEGDVYGYVATCGESEESCWGFYGYEYARAEARAAGAAVAREASEVARTAAASIRETFAADFAACRRASSAIPSGITNRKGTSSMATIQDLAGIAYDSFESFKRDGSEDTIYKLKDDRPEWVYELVRDAHGDFFPDDWRYEAIMDACGWIHDNDGDDDSGEFADQKVDVYTSDRIAWLASSLDRVSYCDEAAAEFGAGDTATDIVAMIALGQYAELSEVYGLVYRALEEKADAEDDDGEA